MQRPLQGRPVPAHRPIAVVMAAALLLVACSRGPSAPHRLLDDTGRFAILPLHRRFQESVVKLHDQTAAFCARPDSDGYRQLQTLWKSSMYDWQALQAVTFGPVTVGNQSWKIQFWPDKHNLIPSKLNALLEGGDEITLQRIDRASAPIQGLSALEYLLFDERGGAPQLYDASDSGNAERRCRVMQRIAGHTVGVASHLANAWDPDGQNYLRTLTNPGADNTDFAVDDDAIVAILDSILATLEIAKDKKLGEPMGRNNDGGFPKPYASEAWRSHYSLPLIAAAVGGARALYYAGDPDSAAEHYGIDDYLRESEAAELADRIDGQFRAIEAALPPDVVLFEAVNDPQRYGQLDRLYQALKTLTQSVKNEIPVALDVTLGFNANDGD